MKKLIVLLSCTVGLAAMLLPATAMSCGGANEVSCASRPPCHLPGYRPRYEPLHPLGVFGICRQAWHAEEPDCDCDKEVGAQSARGPVYGVADTHAHQFSNLAFGGALFWGRPFDERGINEALAPGEWTWDFATATLLDPGWLEVPYKGHEVHGDLILNGDFGWAILSAATEETTYGKPKDFAGADSFAGWPRHDTTTYQQMYYKWLERAYKGGLRLIVMLAVNNEVVCILPISRKRVLDWAGATPIVDCGDMHAVDMQLEAYRALEKFIDDENGGDGWYRIVETPWEARQAIRAGKMAVILGIEVDGLFGCEQERDCTAEKIANELDFYVGQGVRHFFPVHLYDNAFGGSAIYNWLWPFSSVLGTGNPMIGISCSVVRDQLITGPLAEDTAVYEYELFASDLAEWFFNILGEPLPIFDPTSSGHCNPVGLSSQGSWFIGELMDRKLIIDADHFSIRALDRVLQIAENRAYPLISGHSFLHQRPLTERGIKSPPSEGHKTQLQIELIRDLGGIIAPLNPRFEGSSTRDYAHMYKYIVDIMKDGPYGEDYPGIAYASDWGAMYQQTAPRCDDPGECCPLGTPHVCTGPSNTICGNFDTTTFHANNYPIAQCEGSDYPMLKYPFEAVGVGGLFNRQQTGSRIFDFNEDGLAHVGLLPDFFKDLTYVGLTEDELEPLFHSAEVYIRMWEKINGGPAKVLPIISGKAGNNGWYVSDVTVSWKIESEATIRDTDGCDPVTIDYETTGVTLTCFVASDGGETEESVTIKIDKTPPEVSCLANPEELWPPNGKLMPVFVETTFTDDLSGTDVMLIAESSSSEPDSVGKGDKGGDIYNFDIGTASTEGGLRAERLGKVPGRVYTLGYTGQDLAGNVDSCTTLVTVPHDQGKGNDG